MKEERLLIRGFSLLRFPLAVLVIMVHHNYFKDYVGSITSYDVDIVLYSVLKIFSQSAVPCFYIISGFFYFYNIDNYDLISYKKKTLNRVRSLVVPYLLWNLITYVVLASKEILTGYSIIQGGLLHLDVFVASFWLYNGSGTPISAPLWFLRDLIIVVVLFPPIIYKALKHIPVVFLLILIYVNNAHLDFVNKIYPALPDIALLYFSIGACLSLYRKTLLTCFFRHINQLFVIILILYVIGLSFSIFPNDFQEVAERITKRILGVGMIMVVACKMKSFSIYDKVVRLNPTCFFLFACHILFVNSAQVFNAILFSIFNCVTLVYCLSVFLNVSMCLVTYKLCSLVFPKITSVLSGGRT